MDDDEFGIAAFEDPAPSKETSTYLNVSTSEKVRKPPKRRLRFRPEIEVDGDRYKGQRATREELELDTDTLGLFEDDEDGKEEDSIGDTKHSSYEEDDKDDIDISDDQLEVEPVPSILQKKDDEEEEERAIALRLTRAKEQDQLRATAVRKQKIVYDLAVNFRIRLERLMNLARSFPSSDQRSDDEDWESSDELKETLHSTKNSVESLIGHTEAVWETSWPMPLMSDSEEEFTEDEEDTEAVKKVRPNDLDKDQAFEQWRDTILNQWGKKVNDATGITPKGGFKSFDTSVSAQVKAALSSGKQLERSKKLKETLHMLGNNLELEPGIHEMHFDDGEFYRTLLREIIESGDAPGGGLRHAQLSKQGRIKKKRANSAARGKRIRYEVHKKMVGFLPALPMRDLGPVDEIVANLFGVRRRIQS